MAPSQSEIDHLVSTIPSQVRGVGGAIAVVQDDGNIVSQRAWGFANLERRLSMKTSTILPICSISKHMLCLVIADLDRNPTELMKKRQGDIWKQLDDEMRKMLPQLFADGVQGGGGKDRPLKVEDLFNMQSGIRDYWAMTVLWGARAEDPFSLANDAPRALERTKSFHFVPGSEFSYSNVNFHILGRTVENVSGHGLGQLLAERVFIPAGMKTAALSPNCMSLPLPITGYEGSEKTGYFPAVNGIEWQGDAGITASLEDMVAYEKYLHASWKDEKSNYHAIAKPATFNDGSPALYSHGLFHTETHGHKVISHTGGLRGFRLSRLHVPDKQLSVIVLLNHETDPTATSALMLKPLLNAPKEEVSTVTDPAKEWEGDFFNEEQARVISVEKGTGKDDRSMMVNYSGKPENLKLIDGHTVESTSMKASIDGDTLHLVKKLDGIDIGAKRIAAPSTKDTPSSTDYAGEYYCAESESTFTCFTASGGNDCGAETTMYGSFSGYLGNGPIHVMRYCGDDVWVLACPRSMDAPAPGEWTLVFHRDGGGKAKGVTIGCWLARRNEYVRR